MFGIRPPRWIRRKSRAALVWAALPLALLNGRTIVGCGCDGRFDAECHCTACASAKRNNHTQHSCYGTAASHGSCCEHSRQSLQQHANTHGRSARNDRPSLEQHQCTPIILHDIVPATVASTFDTIDVQNSQDVPIADHQSVLMAQLCTGRVAYFTLVRPCGDLVVILRRLII